MRTRTHKRGLIANALMQWRRNQGLSRGDVAQRMGISEETYRNWERGGRKKFHPNDLAAWYAATEAPMWVRHNIHTLAGEEHGPHAPTAWPPHLRPSDYDHAENDPRRLVFLHAMPQFDLAYANSSARELLTTLVPSEDPTQPVNVVAWMFSEEAHEKIRNRHQVAHRLVWSLTMHETIGDISKVRLAEVRQECRDLDASEYDWMERTPFPAEKAYDESVYIRQPSGSWLEYTMRCSRDIWPTMDAERYVMTPRRSSGVRINRMDDGTTIADTP